MKSICLLLLTLVAYCASSLKGAEDELLFDFESENWKDWQVEGTAFGTAPVVAGTFNITGFRGARFVNSFHDGDSATGALTSRTFTIDRKFVSFLICGGRHPGETGVELLLGEDSVRTATGDDSGVFRWHTWDVSEYQGQPARLRIFDRHSGGWGHINVDHVIQTDQRRVNAGDWRLDEYRRSAEYYTELFRPQFHFTPELNWMNDPNGLVFWNGEYHLFYQHNPLGNSWGHMSWGHAVSRDLIHWQHLPIALYEEYGVMIFSGSCVADQNNSSGFGTSENPPLVAIYTGHGQGRQTQDLAYSLDNGRHWTKYEGNPVLDLQLADFRDPKVFWHQESQRWVMVVSLAVEKKLQFYSSTNLKDWELLSEFGPAGAQDKLNWECPDLFELPIDGESGKSRWVLEVDMGNGSIAGGSGGEYFIGAFDGKSFVPDSRESQWVDYGRDFYAPVSWNHIPDSDGRRIWIGWMNNWETNLVPTNPWRSAMSIPRQLKLRRVGDQLKLVQSPVRELTELRGQNWQEINLLIDGDQFLETPSSMGPRLEILAEFQLQTAKEFGFKLASGASQQTVVGYRVESQELFVDRTQSGEVSFHPAFPGIHVAPLSARNGVVRLQILLDDSSVEVFGNDGEVVITDRIFPDPEQAAIQLYTREGSALLNSLQIWKLKSIWRE